jgi:RNA polymerase sigma factor (sigma-70 family)
VGIRYPEEARRALGEANLSAMSSALMQHFTDERLVVLVRAGRDDAFAEIHERYCDRLVAFARRLLHGTGHDAEDVVQDAFMRALAGLRATDAEMHLKPWLYMIVRNRAMDELRKPVRAMAELDEVIHLAPGGEDPALRATERERLRELLDDIGRLPERQRLALVMRELDGATHAQMAATLGTSIPATKSLLVRARTALAAAA